MTDFTFFSSSSGYRSGQVSLFSSSADIQFSFTSVKSAPLTAIYSDIIKWMVMYTDVPSTKPDADLDREIAAMTKEERLAAVLAMAGTWTDLEEDTDADWGFYDWDAPDDGQQIPV